MSSTNRRAAVREYCELESKSDCHVCVYLCVCVCVGVVRVCVTRRTVHLSSNCLYGSQRGYYCCTIDHEQTRTAPNAD
jgi:hypothetical protein